MTKRRPENLVYVFVILQTLEIFLRQLFVRLQRPPENLVRAFASCRNIFLIGMVNKILFALSPYLMNF
jgi:hypothetical protein